MIKKVTARMVREHASQVHGLEFSIVRCEELARDLQLHTTAVAAASRDLDFNDEPARFVALLRLPPASSGKRS